MDYYVDSLSFFKPSIQTEKVRGTLTSVFPDNVQEFLRQRYAVQNTVLSASSVSIDGINYNPDTVMDSSTATSSDATSLTTFLSSVVVASLLSESNSFSVAKLYF